MYRCVCMNIYIRKRMFVVHVCMCVCVCVCVFVYVCGVCARMRESVHACVSVCTCGLQVRAFVP